MDVPTGPWGEAEIVFWSGTKRYQPWKDVAAFFRTREEVDPIPAERHI
jgi:hypothetical protein